MGFNTTPGETDCNLNAVPSTARPSWLRFKALYVVLWYIAQNFPLVNSSALNLSNFCEYLIRLEDPHFLNLLIESWLVVHYTITVWGGICEFRVTQPSSYISGLLFFQNFDICSTFPTHIPVILNRVFIWNICNFLKHYSPNRDSNPGPSGWRPDARQKEQSRPEFKCSYAVWKEPLFSFITIMLSWSPKFPFLSCLNELDSAK